MDQSYWQGAIACRPSATYRGYLLGGLAWFAIPFAMATSLGLASRALDLPVTSAEAGSGLVPPAVAVHMMGEGGAFLVAFQLFLAITSTANSEQLAVASLVCYDVYKRYINPEATGMQMIYVSRLMVCLWGIFSGVVACVLNEMNIGLGWVADIFPRVLHLPFSPPPVFIVHAPAPAPAPIPIPVSLVSSVSVCCLCAGGFRLRA